MKKQLGKNAAEMPITGHLLELRNRLMKSLFILAFFFGIAFYFSDLLHAWFKRPLNAPLVFLSPAEAFWSDLKIALFVGFICSVPAILYEVWQFIAPGLLPSERRYFLPFLFFGTFFFFLGVAFCYFVALPFALNFLIDYGREAGLVPQISVSMYIDFNLKFLFGFGLIFELPLVMVLFSRLGMLTPDLLSRNRKYAVLGAFFIAAVLTPTPDMFNQILMALPLIVLYEVGIIAVRLLGAAAPVKNPPREGGEAAV